MSEALGKVVIAVDALSLDILSAEIREERAVQLRYLDGLDSKAGILLGFAGALVALGGRTGWPANVGRLLAAAAALAALMAFFPRAFPLLDVGRIRHEFARSETLFLRLHLLDTRIAMISRASGLLQTRSRRLRVGTVLLAAGILSSAGEGLLRWSWRF